MVSKKDKRLLIILIIVIAIAALAFLVKNKLYLMKKVPLAQKHSSLPTASSSSDDVETTLKDLNIYFTGKNRPPLSKSNIIKITDSQTYEKLVSGDKNLVVIDIRENYEQKLYSLPRYPNIKYIRLGDLINNKFQPFNKDSEIVVFSFGETRGTIAAYYLQAQEYKDVKLLDGGLVTWALDNFPLSVNNRQQDKDISQILKYLSEEDVAKLESKMIIPFGPSDLTSSIHSLFWDSKELTNYINTLPKDKKYILSCDSKKYCYDALYFWYAGKDYIDFVGYTGFKFNK